MANIQVPPDSTGKKVDTVTLSDAGSEVHRQKLVVTGGSGTAEVVVVTNAAAGAADYGLVVRHAGTATVTGVVTLGAGAANVGSVNNISATVTVAGAVSLAAGTSNIGFLNSISKTVDVAIATPFIIQGISTTVTVAGNLNLTTLNNISQTVQVAIQTPFTLNNISATTTVAGSLNLSGSVVIAGSVNIFTQAEVQSASRGPRMVIASTSANTTLVAAPGANLAIYVTHLAVSNASGSNTKCRVGSSATPGNVTMMLGASGGGFVMHFTPPWQISTNEALLCSIKPNASEGLFNVHYFVGSADAF